jgi:hypothetical protein
MVIVTHAMRMFINLILAVVSSTVFIVLIRFWSKTNRCRLVSLCLYRCCYSCPRWENRTIFRKIHEISRVYKTRGIARLLEKSHVVKTPRGLYPAQDLLISSCK